MLDIDTLIIEKEDENKRLDKLLQEKFPSYSRSYFQSLIEQGLVLANGEHVKKREMLKEGDEVEIEFALTPEISLEAENIPLDILYEDETLLAINKQAGLVVHPGAGNPSHTFVNALLYHCKQLPHSNSLRPGIVHRLDKETSGVLLAAKTDSAHQKLVELFATREMHKEYLAVTIGNPGNCTIDAPIGRHPTRRKEMALIPTGKSAKTRVEVVSTRDLLSTVRLFPATGRTHQLRVHLKSKGTPILGDSVYGNLSMNKKLNVTRQMLHAAVLRFEHPFTGAVMDLRAPLPEDMQRWVDQILS